MMIAITMVCSILNLLLMLGTIGYSILMSREMEAQLAEKSQESDDVKMRNDVK